MKRCGASTSPCKTLLCSLNSSVNPLAYGGSCVDIKGMNCIFDLRWNSVRPQDFEHSITVVILVVIIVVILVVIIVVILVVILVVIVVAAEVTDASRPFLRQKRNMHQVLRGLIYVRDR